MKKIFIFLIAMITLSGVNAQKKDRITIRGFIENPKQVDSITLVVWEHLYDDSKRFLVPHKLTKLRLNNPSGFFQFSDSISGPVYFSIGQKYTGFGNIGSGIFNKYIGEPGDSVTIFNFGGKNTTFYGKGKEKYECRYQLDNKTAFSNPYTTDTTGQLTILERFKNQLSPFIYDVIYADVVGKYLMHVTTALSTGLARNDSAIFTNERPNYANLSKQIAHVQERAKIFSTNYFYSQIVSAAYLSQLVKGSKKTYGILKSDYKGLLREKLLTGYLLTYFEKITSADSLLEDAISIVSNPDYLSQLLGLQDKQAKGKPAFNFSLSNEKGEITRLHDFKGKVVFIDFWFTGCKACILYHHNVLAPVIKDYKNKDDIVFLTVNIDDTRERWLKSIQTDEYTSQGSINLYTDGQGSKHEVIKHYKVVAYPRPLLIDKRGNIFATSVYDLRLDPEKFRRTLDAAISQ